MTYIENEQLRLAKDMLAIREAALNAVDPGAAVRRWMTFDGNRLCFESTSWELTATLAGNFSRQVERIFLIAVGKAAPAMAQAAAEILGDHLSAGLVVTRYGHLQGYPPTGEYSEYRIWTPGAG